MAFWTRHVRKRILILPQPARAAVARPTLSIQLIDPLTVQITARVRLERVHDFLGSNLRFHHCVNVFGSHMKYLITGAPLPLLYSRGSANNLIVWPMPP
jgi:hypothetical protein